MFWNHGTYSHGTYSHGTYKNHRKEILMEITNSNIGKLLEELGLRKHRTVPSISMQFMKKSPAATAVVSGDH